MSTELVCTSMSSPLGPLHLVATSRGLSEVSFDGRQYIVEAREAPDAPILARTAQQLAEYFAGVRQVFDLPFDATGTPFQRGVWDVLSTIPFGARWSYGDVARRIGKPSASRAVGAANGRNPIAIIVPCHRVIGSDGSLTGYGGGEHNKRWLLDHEARHAGSQLSLDCR
jgi:methylated-DNA-[protein]-cysteine S-methyltransferase